MHVYEVTPGIYKFFTLNFFFWNLKHCTGYFKNSKMKLVTSVEWLYFFTKKGDLVIHQKMFPPKYTEHSSVSKLTFSLKCSGSG